MAICCAFGAGAESQIEMADMADNSMEKEAKHIGRCSYLNSCLNYYPS